MSSISDSLSNLIEMSQKTLLDTMKQASSLRDGESEHLKAIRESLDEAKENLDRITVRLESATKDYFDGRAQLSKAVRGGSEEEQLKAYETAESLMIQKASLTEEQKHLRSMAKYLEQEQKRSQETIDRSETLASRLRLALDVMNDNMDGSSGGICPMAMACALAERESKSLARELHDGPAQRFAGAVMSLDYCKRLLELGRWDKAASELSKIRLQMSDIMEEIRSFLFSLYPRDVEDGLGQAMVKFGGDVSQRGRVPVTVNLFGNCDSVSPVIGVSVYKILRQAVDNALASARPSRIAVVLSVKDGLLSAKVMDDGTGFDVEKAEEDAKARGSYGLASMKERARLSGGNLTLESVLGQGTVVSLTVPLGGV